MATTGKGGSTMFWIIGGLIVVAGGIGAYFLLRKPKEETEEDNAELDVNTGGGGGEYGGESVTPSVTISAPAELDSADKIKKFQDWLDTNKPCWLLDSDGKYKNLSKNAGDCDRNVGGKGYGTYGKNTDTAWNKFGKEYLSSAKSTSDKPASTDISKEISIIIKNATGTIADKSYLLKTNADFVKSWAKAITDKKTAFIWANQVYRTYTGEKVLEYNPIGRTFYAKISGKIAKMTADDKADATGVDKGENLGKASGVAYNKGLWLYLPYEGYIYKWYKIDYITSTKPSSSFAGINDAVEFSSFDDNLDL